MTESKKVLVIASAGGHLTQAICATSACDNISLVSNKKNISNDNIKRIYKIWDTQHNPIIHFINLFFAAYVLLCERPSAVFSTGGPIALPFALLCKIIGLRFVYQDTLSRVTELSNTGKLIRKYKLYSKFYSQWEAIAKANDVEYIGKCFDILGENEYKTEKLKITGKPLILVTVGTNDYPYTRLFEALYKHPLYNNPEVEWLIQAGDNIVSTPPKCGKVVTMISRDEIESVVKKASLVISHCGIGSINLMLSYQKHVYFVPRVEKYGEFSDDHQLQIANEIKSKRMSVIYPDEVFPELTVQGLTEFEILADKVDVVNHKFANAMHNELFPSNDKAK